MLESEEKTENKNFEECDEISNEEFLNELDKEKIEYEKPEIDEEPTDEEIEIQEKKDKIINNTISLAVVIVVDNIMSLLLAKIKKQAQEKYKLTKNETKVLANAFEVYFSEKGMEMSPEFNLFIVFIGIYGTKLII